MRIGQKLILGYVVIALFVAVGGGIAIKIATEVMKSIDAIVLSNFAEVEAATEIAYLIQKTKSEIRDHFLETIEEHQEQQQHIEQHKEEINTSISLIQKIILLQEDAIKTGYKLSVEKAEEESKEIKTLKTNLNSLIILVYKAIGILEEKGYEEAEKFYRKETEPLLGKMQDIAKSLEEDTEEEMIIGMGKIRTASQNPSPTLSKN
ncbi:hypothetical protein ES703_51234 [subsurface metagenome]